MVSVSFDFQAKIWYISSNNSWTLIQTYKNHTAKVYASEFINSTTIATGSADGTIQIWAFCTGETKLTITIGLIVYSLQLLSNGFYGEWSF